VQIYALALGKGGSIFMTIIAVIGLMLVRLVISSSFLQLTRAPQNTSIAIVAASRLVFAVARDGVLPMSGWISKVTSDGQPQNAVTVIFIFAAALLCTILPSQVAFTSLVSAGGVPTIAAYGLIALLRLTLTPNDFQSSHFRLGVFAKPFYVSAVFFNAIVFAVSPCYLLPRPLELIDPSRSGYDLPVLLPSHRGNSQFREQPLSSLLALSHRPAGLRDLRGRYDLRDRELVPHSRG
jgi:amino acid transporter